MKRLLKKIADVPADAALLEAGGSVSPTVTPVRETLEDNLIEVAFAEAADYEDIHRAILREHGCAAHGSCFV